MEEIVEEMIKKYKLKEEKKAYIRLLIKICTDFEIENVKEKIEEFLDQS